MEEKSSEMLFENSMNKKISLAKQNAMPEDPKLCFTSATNFTREF